MFFSPYNDIGPADKIIWEIDMKYRCIMVKSVTYAQKSKKILENNGIMAYISKQNKGDQYTCSWCVRVPYFQESTAVKLLEENGVKMTGYIFDV